MVSRRFYSRSSSRAESSYPRECSVQYSRVSPLLIAAGLFCLVLGPTLYIFYSLFGHQIIAYLYTGDPSSVLTHLLQRRMVVPVSVYIDLLDRNIYKILYLPIATLLFYVAAYKIGLYCLETRESDSARLQELPLFRKHDLLIGVAIYAGLTAIYFAPSLPSISHALIGPPEDNMKYLWNIWWGHKAIVDNSSRLTYSSFIFAPEGTSLLYNDYSWYNLTLALGLTRFLNPVATYNLIILHSFLLAGMGAFLLARYLTRDSLAAIIAGFIYAFNPSHFAHALHHINTSAIQFIPLFALFFLRSFREPSAKNIIFASIFFLLNALCDWNYLIFASFFVGFAYIYATFQRRKLIVRDVLLKIVVITGAPVAMLSPWLFQMLLTGLETHLNSFHIGHNMYVADAMGFIVPPDSHLLGSIDLVQQINQTFTGNPWESAVYLGIVNLVTILVLLRKIRRKIAAYVGGFLAFLTLSMGSFVHMFGHTLPVILPYSVLAHLPFVANARAPSRSIVFVYLFLSCIMAFAVKYLLDTYKGRLFRAYGVGFLIVLIVADYYSISFATTEIYLPRCYSVVKGQKDAGGILDLPGGWHESARYMMYQTYHGQPIVQGAIPRKIGRSLIDLLDLENLEFQKQQLRENRITHIVIHKSPISQTKLVDLNRYRTTYTNVCEDNQTIVFKTG